jgi:hypothetical protein
VASPSNPVDWRAGEAVLLTGQDDLAGRYTVHHIGDDEVVLQTAGKPEIRLRPRNTWLRVSGGGVIDTWRVCNVFVAGRHVTNGIVTDLPGRTVTLGS